LITLPVFAPASSWKAPRMDELPDWSLAKRIALDTETHDPKLKALGPGVRRGGYMIGQSFAVEDGRAYYTPTRHWTGTNLDEGQVLNYYRDQAKRFKGEIVGANLGYDLDYLAEQKIEFPHAKFRDVQLADPLIDPLFEGMSLEAIGKRRGIDAKDERLLEEAAAAYGVDVKGGMWAMDPIYVGEYAERDVVSPLLILREQEKDIARLDLHKIWDLESSLLPVLIRMRRRGLRIDQTAMARMEAWSIAQAKEACEKVHAATGVRLEPKHIMKPAHCAAALRAIGLHINDGAKESVTKDILTGLKHPVADAILYARKMHKLRSSFIEGVRKHMCGDRLHPTLNQLRMPREGAETDDDEQGAAFGRLSGSNPNIQNQPSRDDFAKDWREVYLPERGAEWCSVDLSQQEPRWVTEYAVRAKLPGARAMMERYKANPRLDTHDANTELVLGMSKAEADAKVFAKCRKNNKENFLGLIYGMGGAKLARKLGLPTRWKDIKGSQREVAGDEAQAVIDAFDAGAPWIRKLASLASDTAGTRGYVTTFGGRRCTFPKLPQPRGLQLYDWVHKALNRIIQGTAGDQVKKALVDADRAGIFLQIQVHDEVGASVWDRRDAKLLSEIMCDGMGAEIPFVSDIELGKSWGDSMKQGAIRL
jgi:DNA polymerase I-like protein with 3'-5' exonuclease and polymerase domains